MKTSKRKSFKHLTKYERDRIEKLRFHCANIVDMAQILDRNKGTPCHISSRNTPINTIAIKPTTPRSQQKKSVSVARWSGF